MQDKWLEDLDAWMAGDEAGDEEPISVGDLTRVDRELGKLAHADRTEADVREVAAARKAHIDEWLSRQLEIIEGRREWPSRVTEQWMRAQAPVTKSKTVTLPNGTMRLRAPRTSVVVDGEEQAIKWAEENDHPGWVERKPKLLRGELGKAIGKDRPLGLGPVVATTDEAKIHSVIAEGGEVVPGVVVQVPLADGFSVTLSHPTGTLEDDGDDGAQQGD